MMKKLKLSITLDAELISALNSIVIERRLGTRSHALDILLRESPAIRRHIEIGRLEPKGVPLAVHRSSNIRGLRKARALKQTTAQQA